MLVHTNVYFCASLEHTHLETHSGLEVNWLMCLPCGIGMGIEIFQAMCLCEIPDERGVTSTPPKLFCSDLFGHLLHSDYAKKDTQINISTERVSEEQRRNLLHPGPPPKESVQEVCRQGNFSLLEIVTIKRK